MGFFALGVKHNQTYYAYSRESIAYDYVLSYRVDRDVDTYKTIKKTVFFEK